MRKLTEKKVVADYVDRIIRLWDHVEKEVILWAYRHVIIYSDWSYCSVEATEKDYYDYLMEEEKRKHKAEESMDMKKEIIGCYNPWMEGL